MGAQMVREVASKTSDAAGDGTTTATVLAEAIYREGLKFVTTGGSPISLQRGIQQGRGRGRRAPDKILKKVKDKEEIKQVADRFRELGHDDRRNHRRRHGQGRQRRHHHGRGSQVH